MPAGRQLPAVTKNRNYPQPVKHLKPAALGSVLCLVQVKGVCPREPCDQSFLVLSPSGLAQHPILECGSGFLLYFRDCHVGIPDSGANTNNICAAREIATYAMRLFSQLTNSCCMILAHDLAEGVHLQALVLALV
jgi:hypothetical protein